MSLIVVENFNVIVNSKLKFILNSKYVTYIKKFDNLQFQIFCQSHGHVIQLYHSSESALNS